MDESKLPLNWLQGITGGASGGEEMTKNNATNYLAGGEEGDQKYYY